MSFFHPVEHLEKGNIFMTLWASAWVLPWRRGSVSILGNLARGQQTEPGQPCTWDWSFVGRLGGPYSPGERAESAPILKGLISTG